MKNILNLYENFLDITSDLDQLNKLNPNQDDEFGGTNDQVYDEHDYILSPYKNPEFFEGLCNMCEHYQIPYNKNGFLQEDLNQITLIDSDDNCRSYFKNVISLDELQYFHNLKEINYKCFSECKKLKSIILPKNLEIIYEYSFEHCSSLKEIVIPKRFKSLMKNIFSEVNLKKINITYI